MVHAGGEDPSASERRVAGWIAECGIDAGIPIAAFVLLAGQIDQYKARPWTTDDIAKTKEIGLHQMEDRRVRHDAARRLREEVRPWRDIPSMAERVRLWDEAIAVLRMPRGILDNPHNWLRFSPQGKDIRPWTYMGTEIGGWVLQILRSYKLPRPSFGVKSPVVLFVHKALAFIGVNEAPTPKTIGNTLSKTLAPLLEDWPTQ
jgi:hypothetical protein